ncbi:MAG: hypothetical protein ACLFM7_00670 [Bacteroidales bacterium]
MFYTGIITSLLPYILVLGVFGTLLLNRVVLTTSHEDERGEEMANDTLLEKQTFDDNSTFFYSHKDESQKDEAESRFFYGDFELLYKVKKLYSHYKIPITGNPDINSTYSLRGPPA